MKTYTAIIERCPDTGLLVGHVPGFIGAHSQGETHEELLANLKEVVDMLLEDGDPTLETEYIGTQTPCCLMPTLSGFKREENYQDFKKSWFRADTPKKFAQAIPTRGWAANHRSRSQRKRCFTGLDSPNRTRHWFEFEEFMKTR